MGDNPIFGSPLDIIINSLRDESASLAFFGHWIHDVKLFAGAFGKISYFHVY